MSKALYCFRQLAALVAGTVIIGTLLTGGQLFSLMNSWNKRVFAAEPTGGEVARMLSGKTPGLLVNSSRDQHETVVFAAGDIASCPAGGVFANIAVNLSYSLGHYISPAPLSKSAPAIAKLIEGEPGAVVLGLGDLAYPSGSPADHNLCFGAMWGSLKERMFPTPGNHEYKSPGAYGYYDYWGSRAGPDRLGYYGFYLKDWLIVSLNSEVTAGAQVDQVRWLQDTLAGSTARCILGYFHRPAHSSHERPENRTSRELFSVLHEHGASIVLNGHNHFYERTKPLDGEGKVDEATGTVSFISGAVARAEDYGAQLQPFADALVTDATGVLRLSLGQAGYSWRFITDEAGIVRDEGHAECNRKRAASDGTVR